MTYEQMPIRPIWVDYKCDKCNVGYMRPNGKSVHSSSSDRVEFVHNCSHCSVEQSFIKKYPTVQYDREGEFLDLDKYIPQQR